jgi:hypothetical protein
MVPPPLNPDEVDAVVPDASPVDDAPPSSVVALDASKLANEEQPPTKRTAPKHHRPIGHESSGLALLLSEHHDDRL